MTKTQDRLIKSIRSRNFEEYIYVAHKNNSKNFFQEVLHPPFEFFFPSFCDLCIFSDITIFYFAKWPWFFHLHCHWYDYWKTQKMETIHVDASFKARWLRWWNFFAEVKSENKFSSSLSLRESPRWLTSQSLFLGKNTSMSVSFLFDPFEYWSFLTLSLLHLSWRKGLRENLIW